GTAGLDGLGHPRGALPRPRRLPAGDQLPDHPRPDLTPTQAPITLRGTGPGAPRAARSPGQHAPPRAGGTRRAPPRNERTRSHRRAGDRAPGATTDPVLPTPPGRANAT